MKIVYKKENRYNPINFETEAFNNVPEESPKFEVDQIYDDIKEGYNELPRSLQKLRVMMYTYTGDLTDGYERYNKIESGSIKDAYLEFNLRDFFKKSPCEIIDEDPDVNPESPIYIKYDRHHNWDIESLIESYIRYSLKYDDIRLIGDYDDRWDIPKDGDEYLLNSWCKIGISRASYGMVQKAMEGTEDKVREYEEKYIPGYGPANTKFGELLRACQRIKYRYFNDGDRCNWIFDGNILSYVNLAEMLYHWVQDESEEYKFFIDKLAELEKHPIDPYNINGMFYEQCDGDYSVMLVARVEIALVETKEKFPDFMDYENKIDSRDYQDHWY